MGTPKLSAENAIGPALGQYRAVPSGDGSYAGPAGVVPLVPMVVRMQGRCPAGSYECPPGAADYICCDDDNVCYQAPDGTWGCVVTYRPDTPPPPPSPPGTYTQMPFGLGAQPPGVSAAG